MADIKLTFDGLLKPGALEAWTSEKQRQIDRLVKAGMTDARRETDAILLKATNQAFNFGKPGSGKLRKSWRVNVYTDRAPKLVAKNLAKWFKVHTTGGSIGPRNAPRSILIPINAAADARISAKKFYKIIDWLRREKLTVIRNGILYVKPPMNTSRRGGVAAGSRIQKSFRSRFSGSFKRPSGFDIKLNEEGLTPIAIIRSSIKMKKRFDLEGIARNQLLPVVVRAVQARLKAGR